MEPDPILSEVEAFLSETEMTPTAFGRVFSDPSLVSDLREGRECRRAMRARIREFIEQERKKKRAA